MQDDGYIVAAGYSMNGGSRDFALARYTPDGESGSSFGQGGIVVAEYGSLDDEITALAIDQEGQAGGCRLHDRNSRAGRLSSPVTFPAALPTFPSVMTG